MVKMSTIFRLVGKIVSKFLGTVYSLLNVCTHFDCGFSIALLLHAFVTPYYIYYIMSLFLSFALLWMDRYKSGLPLLHIRNSHYCITSQFKQMDFIVPSQKSKSSLMLFLV